MGGTAAGYDVTWSNHYDEAESVEDAIEQALGDLADVVKYRLGPSIFVVYYREEQGGKEVRIPFDIEFGKVVP